ncbi:MAG TPA: cupin domain-containing protein [Rhizobiaceae bacterium]|nr:cupin domain-containing protein [Rhizobiaceae bacterium]
MPSEQKRECRVIAPQKTYGGKQGFNYFEGISKESVGSQGVCLHLLTIPPGGRAKAHKHENHETAIEPIEGQTVMWWGERLENRIVIKAGEMLYIPSDMPHLPANLSDKPATAVIARTDPHEQESVVLLPELEGLVPL